ncbi:DivIVA domain-containing protein, partial [Paenibacillus glucanolyticus]
NKEFDRSWLGYKEDQVNEFLDDIIKDYEIFNKIIKNLQEQNKEIPINNNSSTDYILMRIRELERYCFGRERG